jgi:hypothetical protein
MRSLGASLLMLSLLAAGLTSGSVMAQQGNQTFGGAGGYGNSSPPYNDAPASVREYPSSGAGPRRSANDAYRPPAQEPFQGGGPQDYERRADDPNYGTAAPSDAYSSSRGSSGGGSAGGYASNQGPNQGPYRAPASSGQTVGQAGFGQPYSPPPDVSDRDYGRDSGRGDYSRGDYARGPADPDYGPGPRRYNERHSDGTYSPSEIADAGRGFFGSVSKGLASVIEHAFKRQGRPNGYILGEEAGGAFVAGLRYGEGTLFTRDAGTHKVYWQGPSLGYDFGGEGSKVMVLVYNLRDPRDIFERFGGVDGSAYLVGGVGITFLNRDHVTLAPIRSGIGLRLGANVGYLKYTPRPTWNPF